MRAHGLRLSGVKTVVVHAGLISDASALWRCAPLLENTFSQQGILFLGEATNRDIAQRISSGSLPPKAESKAPAYGSEEFTASLLERVATFSHPPRTALLIFRWGLLHPESFSALRDSLRRFFPNSRIRLFLSLARQDIVLEMIAAWRAMHQSVASADIMKQPHKLCFDYAKLQSFAVRAFGEENTFFCIHDKEENPVQKAWREFWLVAGREDIASDFEQWHKDIPGGEDCFAWPFSPPQDFLAFALGCVGNTLSPSLNSPWLAQALRFCACKKTHIFPRHIREEALARFSASNASLARSLGKRTLFDTLMEADTTLEPDQKFSLTRDLAFEVATKLDRNFAKARFEELDALSRHSLTRQQRICHTALLDMFRPASAKAVDHVESPPPKLSVLTLTYNHAPFIGECIESVLAQQLNIPIQHIIADDGSNDGTQEIILGYAARHPSIVPMLRKDRRKTPWRNVQVLFDMCRTEYAAVCDGDDYFTDPLKLQTQVDFLDAHPECGLCFHPVRVVYEDDPGRTRLHPPVDGLPRGIRPFYYLTDLLRAYIIQTNSVMYRWRFKDGLPDWFRPDLMPGDWYWHLLHAETGKIGFINKIMSVYRRHKGGVYYLSEVDKLKHRALVGLRELEVYNVVNTHFAGKYESILLDLCNGVFADVLLYDSNREEQDEGEPMLDKLCDAYPHFARHFLASLNKVSGSNQTLAR